MSEKWLVSRLILKMSQWEIWIDYIKPEKKREYWMIIRVLAWTIRKTIVLFTEIERVVGRPEGRQRRAGFEVEQES